MRMLDGGGYYRGSSVLLSGTPGSGKTTLGARFLEAGCERGERGMLFAFEESPAQIVRNMRSVGIDLQRWVDEGRLRIIAARPAAYGLETHLARIYQAVEEFEPAIVVIDPLSSLHGEEFEIKAMLSRLIDHFKRRADHGVDDDADPRRVRGSRGAGDLERDRHVGRCQQPRDRRRAQPGDQRPEVPGDGPLKPGPGVSDHQQGFAIRDVYAGERGVLMGSARQLQEARDRAEARRAGRRSLDAKRRRLRVPPLGAGGADRGAARRSWRRRRSSSRARSTTGERRERQLEQDRGGDRRGAPRRRGFRGRTREATR